MELGTMYSQKEYEMVRRQTIELEQSKRAVLRVALTVVSLLLAVTLAGTGWIYNKYRRSEERMGTARTTIAGLVRELRSSQEELAKIAAERGNSKESADRLKVDAMGLITRLIAKKASDAEIAELAHTIFQMPGHSTNLPSIPPDEALRRYRLRIDGKTLSYQLVAGIIDGQWVLYSALVKNRED